jgi:hypothetical protein
MESFTLWYFPLVMVPIVVLMMERKSGKMARFRGF